MAASVCCKLSSVGLLQDVLFVLLSFLAVDIHIVVSVGGGICREFLRRSAPRRMQRWIIDIVCISSIGIGQRYVLRTGSTMIATNRRQDRKVLVGRMSGVASLEPPAQIVACSYCQNMYGRGNGEAPAVSGGRNGHCRGRFGEI